MEIRREIRTKKSLSSVKKNIIPPIIRYDMNKLESTNTSSSVINGGNFIYIYIYYYMYFIAPNLFYFIIIFLGFDTQTVTSTPSSSVTGKYSSTQTIPIIVCLVTMCILIMAAIIFVFHHRRKFNAERDENENSIKLTKRTNELRDIISESTSMSDDDIESKRSSGSSFLAIEVMTNTLSNIIKQQGGKIKISDTNISATNDLVKVKSLELLEHRDTSRSSKRVNSFICMANNIFGKSPS